MRLSALLVPHHLDDEIGQRLALALRAGAQPMESEIAGLLELAAAKSASTAEGFFPFATGTARATALNIISAWYLGVIDDAPGATVFANIDALMFKPVGDVMTVPSYAQAGPNGWGPVSAPLLPMPNF